jgi:predicted amino acid-binding ACT domain protein
MAYRILRADYYHAFVSDQPGAACEVLVQMAELGVNLLAFTAVPMGPMRTQLTLFPAEPRRMQAAAQGAGLLLDGPHPAILLQGHDEIGALAKVHRRLAEAGVEVVASNGIAVESGRFGHVVYLRPQEMDRALAALQD